MQPDKDIKREEQEDWRVVMRDLLDVLKGRKPGGFAEVAARAEKLLTAPLQLNSADWPLLFCDQSNQPKSLLADLIPSERQALDKWLSEQTGDPECGGSIPVAGWPGWGAVMVRRIKERMGS